MQTNTTDRNLKMKFKTNMTDLQAELMEVVRLFDEYSLDIDHTMQIDGNHIISDILVNGQQYIQEEVLAINLKEASSQRECLQVESLEKARVLEQKRLIKRFAKLALYEALLKQTGKALPWGALTGIRPTKLAYQFIEQGKNFKDEFANLHVAKENIDLVAQILKTQQPYYQRQKIEQRTDLYISIPFCPTRCNYCSFITAPISKTERYLEEYLQNLQLELKNLQGTYRSLSSIYIGGGTPLILNVKQLYTLLSAVQPFVTDGIEYTVEAGRPDVFTEEKLQMLKDFSVNRICINPQSFSDKILQNIGRAHTEQDILNAIEMARKYNFRWNCDLIAGLTGESYESFCQSVDKAISLSPDNITVHTLSIKKGADLQVQNNTKNGMQIDRKSDIVKKMLSYSREKLIKAGYVPYYMYRQKYTMADGENIGWCKPSTECIYNIHMMEEIADTIACGANAISKIIFDENDRIERYATPKDIPTYLQKIEKIIQEKREIFEKKYKSTSK